jgi:hypothetical protein
MVDKTCNIIKEARKKQRRKERKLYIEIGREKRKKIRKNGVENYEIHKEEI